MVDIKDIPAEVRWEIAAKSATTIDRAYARAYKEAFQGALGNKFNEIAEQIWGEGGKEAKKLADMLGLPAGNAQQVDNAWDIIGSILYGPEFKSDYIEVGEDRAVTRITGCPFLNRAREMGIDTKDNFGPCRAYCKSAVENLNPKYTQRFVGGMCIGAPYCESIVELKK